MLGDPMQTGQPNGVRSSDWLGISSYFSVFSRLLIIKLEILGAKYHKIHPVIKCANICTLVEIKPVAPLEGIREFKKIDI